MTHRGDYLGVPASEKSLTLRVMDFYRCAGGKIMENWVLLDYLDLFDQLGVDLIAKSQSMARPWRIDAHHHLWDLEAVHYPWLMAKGEVRFFGDPAPIQRNYLLDEFRQDASQHGISGSVHNTGGRRGRPRRGTMDSVGGRRSS